MVKLGEGAEEIRSASLLEANNEAVLSRVLDLEGFDNGTAALKSMLHDLLVNGQRVL